MASHPFERTKSLNVAGTGRYLLRTKDNIHPHTTIKIPGGKSIDVLSSQLWNLPRVNQWVTVQPNTQISASALSGSNQVNFRLNNLRQFITGALLNITLQNTNPTNAAQVLPTPLLINYVRFMIAGTEVQRLYGESMYKTMLYSMSQEQLTQLEGGCNINPTTGAANGTIAGGSSTLYHIPLLGSFFEPIHFYMGTVDYLDIEVYLNGNAIVTTPANGAINTTAMSLKFYTGWYSEYFTNQQDTEMRSVPHDFTFLDYRRQVQTMSLAPSTTYTFVLNSISGLAPFIWFDICGSNLTGTGMITYVNGFASFELQDENGNSLSCGQAYDAYEQYSVGTSRAFPNSGISQYANFINFVPSPGEVMRSGANFGYELFKNNIFKFTTASSLVAGTYNITFNCPIYTSIQLKTDGQVSVQAS